MNEIIQTLLNSEELNVLVGNHIHPNYTTYTGDCIVYTYSTISNDRAAKRQRLTLTIIANDLEKADEIETCVCALLLTLGDAPFSRNIVNIKQNGGGDLFDTARNKNHRIMYFDIVMHTNL